MEEIVNLSIVVLFLLVNIKILLIIVGDWTSGGDFIITGGLSGTSNFRIPAPHGSLISVFSRGLQHYNDGEIVGGKRNSVVLTIHNNVFNLAIKEKNLQDE